MGVSYPIERDDIALLIEFGHAHPNRNLGLVSGAHILPVSAVGSTDTLTNGIALCDNHHRAFDIHRIWVHPVRRTLKIHPRILQHARGDERSRAFVDSLFARLAHPLNPAHAPAQSMFDERYTYFEGYYDWVA